MQNLQNGEIFDGKYQVAKMLGQGGMGTVYQATELALQRQVAIKVVHNHLLVDSRHRARFERESKIISNLKHPNIATFYRFGVFQNVPYFVMELLTGEPLPNVMRKAPLSVSACLAIGTQLCSALQHAHKNNIVHRDVKPSNVMIEQVGDNHYSAKLLDFGLAYTLTEDSQKVTRTGELVGSLHYMSPEQCLQAKVDARSDIYSLGCLIFEMLTGGPPFTATNPIALIKQHTSEAVPDLTASITQPAKPAVITSLNSVIKKAMAKDHKDRYLTIEELKLDLENIANGKTELIKVITPARGTSKKDGTAMLRAAGLVCAALVCAFLFVKPANLRFNNSAKPETKTAVSLHAQIGQLATMSNRTLRLKTALEIAKQVDTEPSLSVEDRSNLYTTLYTDGLEVLPTESLIAHLDHGIKSLSNHCLQAANLIHKKALVYLKAKDYKNVDLCTNQILTMLRTEGFQDPGVIALALSDRCKSFRLQFRAEPQLITLMKSTGKELKLREDFAARASLMSELAFILLYAHRDAEEETLFYQTVKDFEKASAVQNRELIGKWLDATSNFACAHTDPTRYINWLKIQRSHLSEQQWKDQGLWCAQGLVGNRFPAAALAVLADLPVPDLRPRADQRYGQRYFLLQATALTQLHHKREATKIIALVLGMPPSSALPTDILRLVDACARERDYASVELLMEQFNQEITESTHVNGEDLVNQCLRYCNSLPAERRAELGLKQIKFTRKQLVDRKMMCDLWQTELGMREAYLLELAGRYEESAQILRNLSAGDPVMPKQTEQDLHMALAQALMWTGKDQEAQVQTSIFLAGSNMNVPALMAMSYLRLATTYETCGKFQQAEKCFWEALSRAAPGSWLKARVASQLSKLYADRGEAQKAARVAEQIELSGLPARLKSVCGSWLDFYLRKAASLRSAKRFDEAIASLNKAQTLAEMDDRLDKVQVHIEKYLCMRDAHRSTARAELKRARESAMFDTPNGVLQQLEAVELDDRTTLQDHARWSFGARKTISSGLLAPDSSGTLEALEILRLTCEKHGWKDLENTCLKAYNQAQSILYGPKYASTHEVKHQRRRGVTIDGS